MRPWDARFLDLHRQVDEMFEELIYRPWALAGRGGWRPALDLHETPEAYLVEIDLPGVVPEKVRVLVGEPDVTVTGQRQTVPPDGVLFQKCERQDGVFCRALNLPRAVDPRQAHAEYRYGTCRIYLPKKGQPEERVNPTTLGVEESHCLIRVTVL